MPAANSSVIDRVTAAMSLQQADRDQLEARVARYLDDRSPTVRARAIDVVRTRDLRVFEGRILSCLADKNRWVRYAAVECLEVFHEGEATSASYLYPLLDDPHFLV
jgi:HEAT repeat protein